MAADHSFVNVALDVESGKLDDGKVEEEIRFEVIPEDKHVSIEFEGISAFVEPMFRQSKWWQKLQLKKKTNNKTEGMNQILFDISGSVRPGEVLALMGPSGSGKTSMLSILGGRAQKSMAVQGHIRFNGKPLDKRVKRHLGYVMQDDLLYESLTVYETLYYAAMLRLPEDMPHEFKLKRVDGVIDSLGLTKCKDTIIGGFFRRGISGGERKRASVGHELLINPRILLLDEPTSGLDSTTAMQLLVELRQLAHGGRAIITTIHQPSSRLYQQLDKLLLLSGGHAMYYGNAQQAVDYFERLGFSIPPRMNAADFILDLSSGQVASGKMDAEESLHYLIKCGELFLEENAVDGFDLHRDSGTVEKLMEDIRHGIKTEKSGKFSKRMQVSKKNGRSFRSLDSLVGGKDADNRWGASYLSQVRILFQRSLKTRRFESMGTQDVLQLLVIAIFCGLFWFQRGQDDTLVAARDVVGVLFFLLMFLSFRTLFVSLFTFPQEQRYMLKERASGMYRLSAFYVARTLSDIPTDMSVPSVLVLIVYFMAGLRYNAAAFFGIYGALLLSMLVAQSYGLLLGAWFPNPKSAQAVATVIMLFFVLTAGYFVLNIPVWIAWVKYISFVYYGLGLALYMQFDAGKATVYTCFDQECQLLDVEDPASSSQCKESQNLSETLNLVQDISSQGEAIRNGMILLAFLVALRIAVYYVLKSKTSAL